MAFYILFDLYDCNDMSLQLSTQHFIRCQMIILITLPWHPHIYTIYHDIMITSYTKNVHKVYWPEKANCLSSRQLMYKLMYKFSKMNYKWNVIIRVTRCVNQNNLRYFQFCSGGGQWENTRYINVMKSLIGKRTHFENTHNLSKHYLTKILITII